MQLHRSLISLIIAVIVLILFSQSVGLVNQGQIGVRLRSGQVMDTGLMPGLHWRVEEREQQPVQAPNLSARRAEAEVAC